MQEIKRRTADAATNVVVGGCAKYRFSLCAVPHPRQEDAVKVLAERDQDPKRCCVVMCAVTVWRGESYDEFELASW